MVSPCRRASQGLMNHFVEVDRGECGQFRGEGRGSLECDFPGGSVAFVAVFSGHVEPEVV